MRTTAKQSGRQLDRFFGLGRTIWIPPLFSTPYACVRSRLYLFPFPVNVNAHACTFLAICSSLIGGVQRARRGAISDVDEAKPVLLASFLRTVRFSWRTGESEVVDRGRPDNRVGATCISEESRKFSASSPLSFPPRWVYFHGTHPELCASSLLSFRSPVRPIFRRSSWEEESAPRRRRELDSPKSDRCAKTLARVHKSQYSDVHVSKKEIHVNIFARTERRNRGETASQRISRDRAPDGLRACQCTHSESTHVI